MTPALLLPGTLCSEALWERISVPDDTVIQGAVHGETLAAAAAWAVAGAPERVHLVGFSLGAIVAFEVLRRFPECVERLTLISANPSPPTLTQLELWKQQQAQVKRGGFEALAQAQAATAGQAHQRVLAMARQVGPDTFLQQLELLRARPDSRPTLAGWQGSLSILVGENDTVTPPHVAHETCALIPGAVLQIIPNAGHYLPLDQPEAVRAALNDE